MAILLVDKVNTIRKHIDSNKFEAINTFKWLIPRVETDWKLKSVRVEEVYKTFLKMKSSNSRGNHKLTSKVIKQMPHFVASSICNLFNSIVRRDKFPESSEDSTFNTPTKAW